MTHVNGDATHPPWTYTIGLLDGFGHPELIVVGLACESACALLNALADRVAAGCRFAAGEWFVGGDYTLGFRPVHDTRWESGLFAKWHHYYECVGYPDEDPVALQVVWPDDSGRFPEDPGFSPELARIQPLLEGG